ncbi:MAG: CBS domain-containing protein [Chloroflexi bacterium]|nr:CBS domain-containing protein [Chloroflexota bacterium]
MNAHQIMTKHAVTIRADATVGEATDLMRERRISCLPVVGSDGKLVGMLTHSDFGLTRRWLPHGEIFYTVLDTWANPETVEKVSQELRARPVSEVMSQPVVTVYEDASVGDVIRTMLDRRVNHLPVVRADEVVGIITRHDLLKLMAERPEILAKA